MAIDKSLSPYFDDYDEEKLFTSILFRPGKAVQVRELNQIQTILQKQLGRFGNHVFEEGSVVIPGEVNFDLDFKYAKLTLNGSYSTYQSALEASNVFAVGATNGLLADVKKMVAAEGADPLTGFFKYQDSGLSGTVKTFAVAETISFFNWTTTQGSVIVVDSATGLFTEGETVTGGTSGATGTVVTFVRNTLYLSNVTGTFVAAETLTGGTSTETATSVSVATDDLPGKITDATVDEVGVGCASTVTPGVYFVNGTFARVNEQTIILDKYTNTPSYRVGFDITESIVTYQSDTSLLDNASGSPNYTAPGADRLKTDLVLNTRGIDTTDDQDFVEILRLENGLLRSKARGPNYNFLAEVLATRTYDESGDYVVDNFDIALREHLLANDNGGVYTAGNGGDANKLVATLDKGKAYVRGYGVETISTTFVDIDKAQDFDLLNNSVTNATFGNYIKISNMNVIPAHTDFTKITLYSGAVGTDGAVPAGSIVGYARVRYIEYDSGTIDSQASAKFKLYLFDIRDSSGNLDSSVVSSALSVYESTAAFTADITDSAAMFETNNNKLVYKLPLNTIKTLKPGGTSDTTYAIEKVFNTSVSSNQILLNAGTDEIFAGFTATDYLLAIVHDNPSRDATQDVILDISKLTFTLGGAPTGKSLTISSGVTDLSTYEGQSVRLVATMIKTANERVKTSTNTTKQGSLVSSILSLGKADVYKINSVTDDTTTQDITDQFKLDTGKRENFYDISKVTQLPGYPAPAGTITVDFDYFAHGPGDYFSVDSYSGISYEDIPYETIEGVEVCLSDVVDFRPRINDAGTEFTGTGAVHGYMPKPGNYFRADIEYYLDRIDKLYVDQTGAFGVIKGNPGLEPMVPNDPKNAIVLYNMYIPAYTKSTEDVDIESIDNRRYTMRDIGKLENRIKNLEYYTVLSLLEKETSEMKILDGSGNDRFKNGFAVDPFKDHTVGDPDRSDYECSIDPLNGVLRPEFSVEGIDMDFVSGSSTQYQLTGDYITLPYTEQELVKQPFATRTMNVNPYAVFSWVGTVEMSPSRDTWVDTRYTQPVIINQTIRREETKTINKFREVSRANWQVRAARVARPIINQRWGWWGANWAGINLNGRIIGRLGARGRIFNVPTTTTSPQITFSRVGRNLVSTITSISENVSTSQNISKKVIGEKTLDKSIIPFMRQREVGFTGEGFKPFTVVYPFFDNVNVTAHCKPAGGSYGNALKTDASGKVTGTFRVPNTQSLRFRTGTKLFRLIDNTSNDDLSASTFGEGTYSANGILKTQQKTVLSTRTITTHKEITNTTIQTTTRIRWRDPLAESFLIEQEEGVFITSIDVYVATKDNNIPLSLELREMENGYPSQTIIPGGVKTLNPSSINISTTGSDNVTKFTFDRPVYLQGGQEYCFVLMANSTKYNVWIATMGERIVGTQSYVSKQPFIGVMFKSQNNSTWSAAQNDDIKFTIRRAKFDTTKTPTVVFKNAVEDPLIISTNGLLATNTSTTVRAYCPNHGLLVGSKTAIAGATTGFSIPAGEINTKQTVTAVISPDVFEFAVTTPATGNGFFGGSAISVTRNYPYSLISTNIPELVFNNTSIDWDITTKTYQSTDGTETPYVTGKTNLPIINGEEVTFNAPMFVGNSDEETDNMAGANSLLVRGVMSSSKDNVSPVVDIEAMSATVVGNRVNSPTIVETDPIGGECNMRYITKPISLALEATSLKLYIDVNRPQGSGIKVFYRTGSTESEMLEKDWVPLTTITENTENDDGNYYENEYGVEAISEFKYYQIKVVSYATNNAKPATCKDLRAIALGT